MAAHPCPRCGVLIPVGVAYCERCKPIAEQQTAEYRQRKAAYKAKQYTKRRDGKTQSFYRSKEWRTLSRAKLQASGWQCEARLEGCTRLAVEVHHKTPIQTEKGWGLRLDWDGLEAVCVSCHNKRHPGKFGKKLPPDVVDLRKLAKGTP